MEFWSQRKAPREAQSAWHKSEVYSDLNSVIDFNWLLFNALTFGYIRVGYPKIWQGSKILIIYWYKSLLSIDTTHISSDEQRCWIFYFVFIEFCQKGSNLVYNENIILDSFNTLYPVATFRTERKNNLVLLKKMSMNLIQVLLAPKFLYADTDSQIDHDR